MNKKMNKMKVLVGLSGGVDSAVTAYLLKKAGYDVTAAMMTVFKNGYSTLNPDAKGCFSPHQEQDVLSAREICKILEIPFHVIDCSDSYKKTVLDNFRQEYLSGRTPNPCVLCNASIKFQAFPDAARQAGLTFDKFATGHYARVSFDDERQRYLLKTGIDSKKDQSYFLYRLNQDQLARIVFPLGEKTKEEIRSIAKETGLPVCNKPDSQDFYSGNMNDILQAPSETGRFVTKDGKILGTHQGFWNYTVGQRKGLGLSASKPLFVLGFDIEKNNVIVGFEDDNVCHGITANRLNWVCLPSLKKPLCAYAKIRSTQNIQPVRITPLTDDEIKVDFNVAQRKIATGQSVVLYDGSEVLGGGFIKTVF